MFHGDAVVSPRVIVLTPIDPLFLLLQYLSAERYESLQDHDDLP